MQSSRRPKTLMDADRHSLEFTSGQLIIAICGLLFLWLVGFLMGVMAGRLEFGSTVAKEESGATPPAVVAKADPGPAKPGIKPAEAAPAAKPAVDKSKPRTTDIPAPPAVKPAVVPPAPAAAPETKPADAKPAEGAVKYLADRPDRPSLAATQTQAEAKAPETPKTEAPAAPAPAPETVVAKVETPQEAPKPEEAAAPEAKPETKEAEAPKEEPAKTEKAPDGKAFTVQVFSVKAANRSNADEYVSLLKQNSGIAGEVVKSKDGKHFNVVIGRYPDRKAAEAKRDELKKKAGFADCIVREINS